MNKRRTISNFSLDQQRTIENIVSALNAELRPMHYREAYDRFLCVNPSLCFLGEKTSGPEKLRQWFAESSRDVFVLNGNLYLKGWLTGEKDQLFRQTIQGKTLSPDDLAECMYQAGRRHDYMMDKKGTANTQQGISDRQRRAKIEWSIAGAFQQMFPDFYRPPRNHSNYRAHCDHDFLLNIGTGEFKLDAKEFTRQSTTILTNIKPDVTYVFGAWNGDHATMMGYLTGCECGALQDISYSRFAAKEAKISDLTGLAMLIVYLNMRLRGENLMEVRRIHQERLNLQTAEAA